MRRCSLKFKESLKDKTWKELLKESFTSKEDLAPFSFKKDIAKVIEKYPMRINSYYFSLIEDEKDPVYLQCVPDLKEIEKTRTSDDPFCENRNDESFIHRYPDRILLKVSNSCAVNCRHCMRKRDVGKRNSFQMQKAIKYLKENKSIDEVILSGGDPLVRSTGFLSNILDEITGIDHVSVVRIHTRVLCTLPQRITDNLVKVLKKVKTLYIVTHFNHPAELTDTAKEACRKLIDSGIPVYCQTVLLKNVNNSTDTLKKLFRELVKIRIKPYYLHHPDPIKGTDHFRVTLDEGLKILKELRGNISGLSMPQYMLELPESSGKIPLLPEYVKAMEKGIYKIENFQGKIIEYRDLE